MIQSIAHAHKFLKGRTVYRMPYYFTASIDAPPLPWEEWGFESASVAIVFPFEELTMNVSTDGDLLTGKAARTPGEYIEQGPEIPRTKWNEVTSEQWIYTLEPVHRNDGSMTVSDFLALYDQNYDVIIEKTLNVPTFISDAIIIQRDYTRSGKRYMEYLIVPLHNELRIRTWAPWWGNTEPIKKWVEEVYLWMDWDEKRQDWPVIRGITGCADFGTRLTWPFRTGWFVDVTARSYCAHGRYDSSLAFHTLQTHEEYYDEYSCPEDDPVFGDPEAYLTACIDEAYSQYRTETGRGERQYWSSVSMVLPASGGGGPTLPRIPSEVEMERIQREFAVHEEVRHPDFSSLDIANAGTKVIENFNRYNSNMPAYVMDIGKFGDSARAVRRLVKDLRNPKAWASAWLSGRYSDRLTIADTIELIEGVRQEVAAAKKSGYDRWRHRIRQEGKGEDGYKEFGMATLTWSYEDYMTFELRTTAGLLGDCENILASLHRWDLAPTLENIWDMLPYSFVVDWCAGVSALFERIDAASEAKLIDAKAQIVGKRRSMTMDLRYFSSDLRGTVTHISYERKSRDFLSEITPIGIETSTPRPINFVDGAALGSQALLRLS